MNVKEFAKSKWYKRAQKPDAEEKVESGLSEKMKKIAHKTGLVEKAKTLHGYFKDPNVPLAKKTAIVAALLYFISPFDTIPDFAPIAGFIDDIAVISMVIAYVTKEMAGYQVGKDASDDSGELKETDAQVVSNKLLEAGVVDREMEDQSPSDESKDESKADVETQAQSADAASEQPSPKHQSLKRRVIGYFFDDYIDELETRTDAQIEKELKSKIKAIQYCLLAMIAASLISLAYFALQKWIFQ